MSSINANSASVLSYQSVIADTNRNDKAEIGSVVASERQPQLVNRVAEPPAHEQLQQAVDVVNQAVALQQRALNFSIDELSGRSVIKVVDYETEELIKQIPSEELLKVAQDIRRLQDEMGQSIGLLVNNKV